MPAIRDREYAAVVERERPLIQATAYLLTGDPVQAERVVQLVFAQLYGRWPAHPRPRLELIRAVVDTARGPVHLPWEHYEGFELVDGLPPVPVADPVVANLRGLSYDQRVVIVLECYVGLAMAQIANVLGRQVGDVLSMTGRARNILAAGHPARRSDEALAQELQDAIPHYMRESHGSADDLAHGRRLARRRWIYRASTALVAVAAIVVAVVLLVPTHPPVPQAAPPLPTPTQARYGCDPSTTTCQAQILIRWRSRMAEVASTHLDPTGMYFTGFGYSYNGRYDTPTFWNGNGGALAFELFRLDKGATEVWLQVASSRSFAVRCGATTRQKCMFIRFMDGNSYLMTDSTLADGGIEVQYSPDGKEVITVVARNTQRGRILKLSTGDLIKLVQDERLRLPQRCCYRR